LIRIARHTEELTPSYGILRENRKLS
jgi:hypothetical protein